MSNIIQITIGQPEYIKSYLNVVTQGKLTDVEVLVLSKLIAKHLELQSEGLKGKYLNKILFSHEVRKEIYLDIKYTQQNFNNYFKSLKDKGAILENNNEYSLNEFLIPKEFITFKWNIL